MDKFRIEQFHQLNDMQHAVNIRLDRFIHGRIEIHHAGEVHHNIDSPFELLGLLSGYAAKGLVQITFHNLNFLPDDALAADAFDDLP